ncbi:MAG: WlaTC/HtrL family glycosyltransferase [Helicobacter sp.]|nr:WlaTC/HtrL family glycosyltransferase [Helicobacter sp.]
MSEISIVSAFYDIKRELLDDFKRDDSKYFEYFSFLAGIKNHFIIYTTQDYKDKILSLRAAHGLEAKTTIIVKPLESFEAESLEKIERVFKDYNQGKGRRNPNNIECISPLYCYLMWLKPFFVCDAKSRGIVGDNVLWLDFGFNHGGKYFTNKGQFNFTLITPPLDKDKMHFFKVGDDRGKSLAQIYFDMSVCFQGGLLYGGVAAWERFREHFREALNAFSSLNIFDDDQILLLWCYRNYPQFYNIAKNCPEWFDSLELFIPQEICKTLERNLKNTLAYRVAKENYKKAVESREYLLAFKEFVRYCYLKIFKKDSI